MMIALATAMSYLEGLVPSVGVPGIKLGLSNIVTMYALLILGTPYAVGIAVSKCVFVLLTRGMTAALLSLSGGLLSVIVMRLLKRCGSIFFISVFGAVAHNVGQIVSAAIILRSADIFWYLPILVISGFAMGAITAFTLKSIMPYLRRNWSTCVKAQRNYHR